MADEEMKSVEEPAGQSLPIVQLSPQILPLPVVQSSPKVQRLPVVQPFPEVQPSPLIQPSANTQPPSEIQPLPEVQSSLVVQHSSTLQTPPEVQSLLAVEPLPAVQSTSMNQSQPMNNEKTSSSKIQDEPQQDIEFEGACFDVLDMVEESFDNEVISNYDSSCEADEDGICQLISDAGNSSADHHGNRSEKEKDSVAGCSRKTSFIGIDDQYSDIDMIEQVSEMIDGDENDYEECDVAERPPSPANYPLPEGWRQVYHESGATIFVHLETNVCSLSRPYFLGVNSTKSHCLPITAVPCFNYRPHNDDDVAAAYASVKAAHRAAASSVAAFNEVASNANASDMVDSNTDANSVTHPTTTASPTATSSATSPSAAAACVTDSVATNPTASGAATSTTTHLSATTAVAVDIADASSSVEDTAADGKEHAAASTSTKMETMDALPDEVDGNLLAAKADELRLVDYCHRLFKFKKIKYLKFRSWDVRRTYLRALRNERNRRKCPFSNNKFVSFPIETTDDEGNVVTTKKWILNPRGRSYVAILHEYLQQSKKTQPEYKFSEVDNARTPYAATVVVNGTEYGTGLGMSKKEAKFEAAKATLQVLLPKMMKYVLSVYCDKTGIPKKYDEYSDGDDELQNVASAFDDISITDPRVTELSMQTTEPKPYELLLNCLQKKGGDQQVQFDFQPEAAECTMSVGDQHKVTIQCVNKREGKHLAAQALLQLLHPHVHNWGSLLRLYGNNAANQLLYVNDDKDVGQLKTKPPNTELLQTLKQRMSTLAADDNDDA